MNQEDFSIKIASKKEDEWIIPFEDLDIVVEPYDTISDLKARQKTIGDKQRELVDWFGLIPNCNWSVGFIDNEEQNAMVVKWWFKDEDYPVEVPEK